MSELVSHLFAPGRGAACGAHSRLLTHERDQVDCQRCRRTVEFKKHRPHFSQWGAQFRLTHESFGGYTHSDGFADVQVQARTEAEAREKARRLVRLQHRGYDCDLISIGRK